MPNTRFDDHLFANKALASNPLADNTFGNTPFRDNLKKLLREKGKAGAGDDAKDDAGHGAASSRAGSAGALRTRLARRAKVEEPDYSDECALFLSAMDGMRTGGMRTGGMRAGGIRMGDDSKAMRRSEEMRFTLEDVENFPGNGRGKGKDGGRDVDKAMDGAWQDARKPRQGSLPPGCSGKGRSMAAGSSPSPWGPEKTGMSSASKSAAGLSQEPAPQRSALQITGMKDAAKTVSESVAQDVSENAPEDVSMDRLLRGEEGRDEFLLAMEGVKPLRKAGRDVAPAAPASSMKHVAANVLQDIIDGKVEFELTFTDEYIEGYVIGVNPLIIGKLRQGGYSPEASLDLHGLNSLQAFEALRAFIKAAWYRGTRCLVVVPGRGKNSPNGHAILREKLKLWFTQDPFKRVILAFCTARAHDGGPGAVYVLLRKFKKKGRVAWERVPADEDLL